MIGLAMILLIQEKLSKKRCLYYRYQRLIIEITSHVIFFCCYSSHFCIFAFRFSHKLLLPYHSDHSRPLQNCNQSLKRIQFRHHSVSAKSQSAFLSSFAQSKQPLLDHFLRPQTWLSLETHRFMLFTLLRITDSIS